MRTPKRILVGMDFSSTDYRLIEFLNALNGAVSPEKVYFLHVSPSLDIPAYMSDFYREELQQAPIDEKFRTEMAEEVNRKLTKGNFETEFEVIEGPVTRQLIHRAKVKNIDLAILGKKAPSVGSGVSTKRFLRQTDCSVLFVPDKPFKGFRTLLVPVDFSENSSMALKKAIAFAAALNPKPVIKVLNVFDVPTELQYRISRTYAQFAEIVKKNTEDFFPEYLGKFDKQGVQVDSVLIQNTHFNTSKHILEYAQESSADLIMMGAQGHTALESFLLGSVTEKLLGYNETIPTWIIRPPMSDDAGTDRVTSSSSIQQAMR
jgi:nucleotide-binding universal stress UspA family protein